MLFNIEVIHKIQEILKNGKFKIISLWIFKEEIIKEWKIKIKKIH